MTPEDLKQVEEIVEKHRPSVSVSGGAGFATLLFVLFLNGCFKGCGY